MIASAVLEAGVVKDPAPLEFQRSGLKFRFSRPDLKSDAGLLTDRGEKSCYDFVKPFENFCERSETKSPKGVLFL